MIPIKRAEAIMACFRSHTYCKWATENYLYELAPYGDGMVLRCGRIESDIGVEIAWTITNAVVGHVNYADCLKLEVDDGLTLQFYLETEEESE